VEVDGEKMVPLKALQAERQAMAELRKEAQRLQQVEQDYRNAQPYVEFLRNNPDLLKRPAAAEPAPPAPDQDPKLVNLARTLDLYTADGKPDAARAATIRELVKSEAQSIAQDAVKPFAEMNVRERAQRNFQDALNTTLPDGSKPDPETIKHIWSTTDPKFLADPNNAALALLVAGGLGAFKGQPAAAKAPEPPATAPVVTESAGRVNPNRAPVSELETRVMGIRGITPQKYADYIRNFKPGQTNVLESD
jgi:hypothetical protein